MFKESVCKGTIRFELTEPYRTLLDTSFRYLLTPNSVTFSDDQLTIHCLENQLHILLDGLLFIAQYGKLLEGKMVLVGLKRLTYFTIREGLIFKQLKKIVISQQTVITAREVRKLVNAHTVVMQDEDILYLKGWVITQIDRFTYHLSPLTDLSEEERASTPYNLLRQFPIDVEEKRTIELNNEQVPLWELFMLWNAKEKKEEVSCHICVHRLRKLTQGCADCIPKKTYPG